MANYCRSLLYPSAYKCERSIESYLRDCRNLPQRFGRHVFGGLVPKQSTWTTMLESVQRQAPTQSFRKVKLYLRLLQYRASSWSWASMEAGAGIANYDSSVIWEACGADISEVLITQDIAGKTYSPARGGYTIIRGQAGNLRLHYTRDQRVIDGIRMLAFPDALGDGRSKTDDAFVYATALILASSCREIINLAERWKMRLAAYSDFKMYMTEERALPSTIS
ncbi:hypothetical protein DE146DRAFT_330547 [Phaeosphaeria sp. MPI-PUGE-AT-0046c]|nr:hypothetical protein DE146DRAFT_330547 [Phaeosphaeria sp. MPI-PUGE-AT-0046c]